MMASSARFRRPGFPVVLGGCAVLLTLGIALALLAQPVALSVLGVAAIVGAWLLPVLYAVHFRARARFRKTATGEDVRTSQKALVSAVDKARQRFSTEQSRQDRALTRIEEHLRGLTAASESRSFQVGEPGIDVLFVTSNGAGLGHISRSMAIARQLAEGRSFEILTLSSAYRQVAGQGVTTHYFPSSGASGEMSRVWNRHFRAHLLHLMEEKRPRVVVFDGTWVYAALTEICKLRGTPLIWIQRGMWQDKVDKASTQRHAAAKVADHVIVPGDFAGDELVDPGPGIVPRHVGPIVMTTKDDVIGRDAACAALELDPSRRYVLLNLGGGGISDPGTLALSFRQLLKDRAPDLRLGAGRLPAHGRKRPGRRRRPGARLSGDAIRTGLRIHDLRRRIQLGTGVRIARVSLRSWSQTLRRAPMTSFGALNSWHPRACALRRWISQGCRRPSNKCWILSGGRPSVDGSKALSRLEAHARQLTTSTS